MNSPKPQKSSKKVKNIKAEKKKNAQKSFIEIFTEPTLCPELNY